MGELGGGGGRETLMIIVDLQLGSENDLVVVVCGGWRCERSGI